MNDIFLTVRGCTEPEGFTLYPEEVKGVRIIQSDNRIGRLYASGHVEVTAKIPGGAYQPHLALAKIKWQLQGEELTKIGRLFK